MMEWAREMVRACTGVNEEILGLAGREQPGVLEAQRKQAAYGLLSPFFDAQRRYLRKQGKLQLAMIRLYLPEDTLVRIVDEGTKKYVPVAYTMDAAEYDVRVDESARWSEPEGHDLPDHASAYAVPARGRPPAQLLEQDCAVFSAPRLCG